jgi:Relaxase/Mobilisation nuclease domain
VPKVLLNIGGGPALFDIGSYGRRGPARRDRFSKGQIDLISRTVHRTPEVMVKVLSRGARDVKAVARHVSYLGRNGKVEIETDEGQRLRGRGVEKAMLDDWDLDLDETRRSAALRSEGRKDPPRLVHKLIFSMPAGTPADKVLAAVKRFAREEFGAKHRYAMALHTDEPHPHVHVVVKAMGEDGRRLNIRKATLREWRQEFARHLREEGVPANATERAARGVTRSAKLDGIHRAGMRGASTHHRQRVEAVGRALVRGEFRPEAGKARLLATRQEVVRGWEAVRDQLITQGEVALARRVEEFAMRMPLPLTDNERIREALLKTLEKTRTKDPPARAR